MESSMLLSLLLFIFITQKGGGGLEVTDAAWSATTSSTPSYSGGSDDKVSDETGKEQHNIPNFSSLSECINLTQSCYGHGECIHSVQGPIICDCADKFDFETSCNLTYLFIWKGVTTAYCCIGYVVYSILTFIMMIDFVSHLELKLQQMKDNRGVVMVERGGGASPAVISGSSGAARRPRRIPFYIYCSKITGILFFVIRFAYFAIMNYYDVHGEDGDIVYRLYRVDSSLFSIGAIFGVVCYFSVILIWADIVSKSKSLLMTHSAAFKIAIKSIYISMFVYALAMIPLCLLSYCGVLPTLSNVVMDSFTSLYLLSGVVWSSVQLIRLERMIDQAVSKSKKLEEMKKKNVLFLGVNLVLFCYIVKLVVYSICLGRRSRMFYIVIQSWLRFDEMILMILFTMMSPAKSEFLFRKYCCGAKVGDHYKRGDGGAVTTTGEDTSDFVSTNNNTPTAVK